MINTTVELTELRAQEALQASPVVALRDLRVQQTGQSLLLSGQVTSFYHKQLAQEVVLAVSGVCEVVNSIVVR